jgi:hypothetical protein
MGMRRFQGQLASISRGIHTPGGLFIMKRSAVNSRPGIAEIDIDDRAAGLIERNIDGVFDFLSAVAADPTMIDRIPHGAEIVLEHVSDPALSAANRRASLKTSRSGGPIYIHRVRERPALAAGSSRVTHRSRPTKA